jgi:hypothetical protein
VPKLKFVVRKEKNKDGCTTNEKRDSQRRTAPKIGEGAPSHQGKAENEGNKK